MPELPEIKAEAYRLDQRLSGGKLKKIIPIKFTVLKTYKPSPNTFNDSKLESVTSRGKYIIFNFDHDLHAVVHLMQGGRLKILENKPTKNTQAIFDFSKENEEKKLALTEAGKERKAGMWLIEGAPENQEPLNKLGIEADKLDESNLKKILSTNSKRIHLLLRDQSQIAGIGRMLANEIIHKAKISPFLNSKKLSDKQTAQLYEAIKSTLKEKTKEEMEQENIRPSKQRSTKVHNKAGEICSSCEQSEIKSIEYNNYTIFYCPHCQTEDKILADNTTSKFLK